MNNKNTGRYYWTTDFKTGNNEYRSGNSMIENLVFEDDLIQFHINNPGKEDDGFRINLTWDSIKRVFTDKFGDITAELFKSETKSFVYGVWKEEGYTYTWWAITD